MATAMGTLLAQCAGSTNLASLPFPPMKAKPIPFHALRRPGVGGFYIDDAATQIIMETFLDTLNLQPDWLSVDPAQGTVTPSSSVDVSVTLDAFVRRHSTFVGGAIDR